MLPLVKEHWGVVLLPGRRGRRRACRLRSAPNRSRSIPPPFLPRRADGHPARAGALLRLPRGGDGGAAAGAQRGAVGRQPRDHPQALPRAGGRGLGVVGWLGNGLLVPADSRQPGPPAVCTLGLGGQRGPGWLPPTSGCTASVWQPSQTAQPLPPACPRPAGLHRLHDARGEALPGAGQGGQLGQGAGQAGAAGALLWCAGARRSAAAIALGTLGVLLTPALLLPLRCSCSTCAFSWRHPPPPKQVAFINADRPADAIYKEVRRTYLEAMV